jgi:predicted DNA-binding ribbon-helix-helix protein
MQSSGIKKRSIALAGHKTSVSLEDEFWECLREIAEKRGETSIKLITDIDAEREFSNLSSAIRMFVLRYYRDELEKRGGPVISPRLDPANSIEHTARK